MTGQISEFRVQSSDFRFTTSDVYNPLMKRTRLALPAPALAVMLATIVATGLHAQTKPRARDLGVPFDGTPGPLNAITDVPGVEVGMTTLISGDGPLKVGVGPVRTGVTAILPRGRTSKVTRFLTCVNSAPSKSKPTAFFGNALGRSSHVKRASRSMKRLISQALARRSTQGDLRVAQTRLW